MMLYPQSNAIAILSKFQDDMKLIRKSVQKYQLISELTALNDAVYAWERMLNCSDFLRTEGPIRSAAKNDAGNVYLQRYWARGRILDLNVPWSCANKL